MGAPRRFICAVERSGTEQMNRRGYHQQRSETGHIPNCKTYFLINKAYLKKNQLLFIWLNLMTIIDRISQNL